MIKHEFNSVVYNWGGYMNCMIHRDSDHLEHHGILGQKWGVRRYQNPDGTLTEEGKKRYLRNGKYDETTIMYDYNRDRYSSKGKAAFNIVKNEVIKSDAYSKAKETLAKANVKPSDMHRVKPKKAIKASVKEIDDFIRKTLNNLEYNRESPDNTTTMMAHEFVHDILKDISKERKHQMRNDPSERLNSLTIGDALKSAAIGALAGPGAASFYTAQKLAEDRPKKDKK